MIERAVDLPWTCMGDITLDYDTLSLMAEAGCVGGILPKGGKAEKNVAHVFADHGMRVAFLPKDYRGFSRH